MVPLLWYNMKKLQGWTDYMDRHIRRGHARLSTATIDCQAPDACARGLCIEAHGSDLVTRIVYLDRLAMLAARSNRKEY